MISILSKSHKFMIEDFFGYQNKIISTKIMEKDLFIQLYQN